VASNGVLPDKRSRELGAPRRARLEGIGAAVLAMGIVFLREPEALLEAQLWAEDGRVFLWGALSAGPASLFEPFAGYFHTIPRIVALVATWAVALEHVPLFFNGSAILVVGLTTYLLATARVRLTHRWLHALVPVLVPQSGEIFASITYAQWFGGMVLLATLAQRPPETRAQKVRDGLVLVVFGLTGPFLLLLSPFLLWRWQAPAFDDVRGFLSGTVIAIAAATLVATLADDEVGDDPASAFLLAPAHWWPFAETAVRAIVRDLFLGPFPAAAPLVRAAGWIVGLTLVGLAIVTKPAWTLRSPLVSMAAFSGLVLLAARLKTPDFMFELLSSTGYHARYLVVAHTVLVWALVAIAMRGTRPARGVAVGLLLLAGASAVSAFRVEPVVDYDWKRQVEAVGHSPAPVVIPPNWTIEVCRPPCALDPPE
jgi:hypothetical protein